MRERVKIISLFLVCLVSAEISLGQTFNDNWQWANGISSQWQNPSGGTGLHNKQNMTLDEKGNIYTLSIVFFNNIKIKPSNSVEIDTMGQSGRDLILSKYNCAGDLVWWKPIATKYKTSMGSILNSGNEGLNGDGFLDGNIICDKQGNLFFSFYHARNDTILILDSSYYHNDALDANWKLLKVDTNGVLLKLATFERSDSINITITDWVVSDNGEVYCTAQTLSDSNTPSISYGDILPGYRTSIGKLNKQTLDFEWIKRFPAQNLLSYGLKGNDIELDHDENIILGGYVSDTLSIYGEDFFIANENFGVEDNREAFVVKLDTSGNLIWFSRAKQAQPNVNDTVSLITENGLSIDENNNVYTALLGPRAYFPGIVPNDDSTFTSTMNVLRLNGNTGLAEWILYADEAGGKDQWFATTTHYNDGVLYCGGYHGKAKIDTTTFNSLVGAFDPLLVAVNPSTGELTDWLKIPADGGTYSFIHDIDSDEKGNLFLNMMQNGPIEFTGYDTINELHTGRPTGLIAKYGEAACVCTPPSVQLEVLQVDTINQEVTFNASATNYQTLSWDFGDGNEWLDTSITSFNYVFAEDTSYQICVTALSDDCGTAMQCINIDLYQVPMDTTITDTTITDTTIVDTTIIDAVRDINQTNWGISVYPNPTQDKVFIDLSGALLKEDKDVLIFDVRGVAQKQVFIKAKQKSGVIDLTNLSPGIYILQLDNGKHQYVGKIIKQE